MEKTTVESTGILCSKKRKVNVALEYLSAILKRLVGTCSFSENIVFNWAIYPVLSRSTASLDVVLDCRDDPTLSIVVNDIMLQTRIF